MPSFTAPYQMTREEVAAYQRGLYDLPPVASPFIPYGNYPGVPSPYDGDTVLAPGSVSQGGALAQLSIGSAEIQEASIGVAHIDSLDGLVITGGTIQTTNQRTKMNANGLYIRRNNDTMASDEAVHFLDDSGSAAGDIYSGSTTKGLKLTMESKGDLFLLAGGYASLDNSGSRIWMWDARTGGLRSVPYIQVGSGTISVTSGGSNYQDISYSHAFATGVTPVVFVNVADADSSNPGHFWGSAYSITNSGFRLRVHSYNTSETRTDMPFQWMAVHL